MQEILAAIIAYGREGASLREKFFRQNTETIRDCAFQTALALAQGKKLLLCGNGGSAADCQHIAGEFINRFLIDRPGLPAIALTTDTSVITAIGNDSAFEFIFSRQVEALGAPGDVLLAISTSGNSKDVLNAIDAARSKQMAIIGLTGAKGGKMAGLCNWLIEAPSRTTPLIQEMHLACEHMFCQLVDYFLFENPSFLSQALNYHNDQTTDK